MSRIDPAIIPPAPDITFERVLWRAGVTFVAGIDEAGRGALAGPVIAAAVVLPDDPALQVRLDGVRDSKQVTPARRAELAEKIMRVAVDWGVGEGTYEEVDCRGIIAATRLAVIRALGMLRNAPEHLLTDYILLPECPIPQTSLIKGDQRSLSIAAASILAKTTRDALMVEVSMTFPGYGFDRNKGYGTEEHRAELARIGACAIHRKTFHGVGHLLK